MNEKKKKEKKEEEGNLPSRLSKWISQSTKPWPLFNGHSSKQSPSSASQKMLPFPSIAIHFFMFTRLHVPYYSIVSSSIQLLSPLPFSLPHPLMASSTETPVNSHQAFSFMTSSFTDLLSADDQMDNRFRIGSNHGFLDYTHDSNNGRMSQFKSITPPLLPISPPPFSPSSFFSFPPGLSFSELLDSPVLFSSSNVSWRH